MAIPTTDPARQSGAVPLDPDGKRSRKGLWLLLGLIALLALAALAFLLVRNAADDGDDSGIDTTDDAQDGESESGAGRDGGGSGATTVPDGGAGTTAPADGEAGTATTAAPGAGDAALVTGGGAAVVPPPAGGLGDRVDEDVTGTATVESVVADEGFWVGLGPGQRVFVVLTPEARTSQGESPFQVEVGQTIAMTGTLVMAPSDPASIGVEGDEGADELAATGAYIEAIEIALSE